MEFVCRYGEMILKSKPVRRSFTRRLTANIQHALKHLDSGVSMHLKQAFLTVESEHPESLQILSRIFGISSLAQIESFPFESLPEIIDRGVDFFVHQMAGKKFAVRCRRIGTHPFNSLTVERELGAKLAVSGKVDLTHPEITCTVEIRNSTVSYTSEVRKGAGGLPIGSQGRGICLISGGFDSPVAAWHALRRGLRVDYLFCCLGGPFQMWGPKSVARHLAVEWSYGYSPKFFTMDFTGILAELKKVDPAYRNILLKRFFIKAADRLVERSNADAIITGDVLGQVSSQTISNLTTISKATQTFIFRPLIALDKNDVLAKAQEIGTYSISERVPEFCNIAVQKPRTTSNPETVESMESLLPDHLLENAMRSLRCEDLRSMEPVKQIWDCAIDYTPANAIRIFISAADDHTKPDSDRIQIGVTEIRDVMNTLSKDAPIVLDCRKGTLSKDAAAYFREHGFEAYYLRKHREI